MQLGTIGLGRMGASMVLRLLKNAHACLVHDVQRAAIGSLQHKGATGATSLQHIVLQMAKPRAAWLMVPAGIVNQLLGDPVPLLDAGDSVIDGGNSYCRNDIRRGAELHARGIHYLAGNYWKIFEKLGLELGYTDYLGALQRYRSGTEFRLSCDPRLLQISSFLVDYPFAGCLYPVAVDVIGRLIAFGPTVILSHGNVVCQPRKFKVMAFGNRLRAACLSTFTRNKCST